MYAAFFLLIAGYILKFETKTENWISWFMIFGTMLFSFSIWIEYAGLFRNESEISRTDPPLGGLLMILSWTLLIFYFVRKVKNKETSV
jgi:uncharacterized membrane protein YgdD (TMEM256/DUF423 family)